MNAIFLDTHIVLWLFANKENKFPEVVKDLIESSTLYICPIVMLELQYLQEIGRINYNAETIIENLQVNIELKIDNLPLDTLVREAIKIQWTRDPFDRLIAAAAISRNYPLLTKDEAILRNLALAIWNAEEKII